MELQNKYTVIKNQDKDYLSPAEQDILAILLDKIADRKAEHGKKPNSYFVLNLDTENIEVTLPVKIASSDKEIWPLTTHTNVTWKMNANELVEAIELDHKTVELAEKVMLVFPIKVG